MKKLFSITQLLNDAKAVFVRFPLAVFFASLSAIILIFSIVNQIDFPNVIDSFFPAIMGIPLFIAIECFSELRFFSKRQRWISNMVGLFLWAGLYFYLRFAFQQNDAISVIKVAVNLLILHLAVAALPFFNSKQTNGFWQFNRILFLRVFITAIYTLVLTGGLSGALLACDKLLGIPVHFKAYRVLYAFICIFLSVIIFLAGLPKNLNDLESDNEYPKGLRVFVQFVLIPLVIIYMLILYGYSAKILIQWHLPEGYVTNLIMVFSVLGMLSLLLVYPYQNQEGQGWIKWYTRSYFWLIIPLLVTQFVAIGVRIAEYGFTEPRLSVLILALWLLFVAISQLYFKGQKLIFIPSSLAIIAFLAIYSPFNIFTISIHSQSSRSLKMADSIGLVKNGKLTKVTVTSKNEKTVARLYNQSKYLVKRYYITGLEPYLTFNGKVAAVKPKNKSDWEIEQDCEDWLELQFSKYGIEPFRANIENDDQPVSETVYFYPKSEILNIPTGTWSKSKMLSLEISSEESELNYTYNVITDNNYNIKIYFKNDNWESEWFSLLPAIKAHLYGGENTESVDNQRMIFTFKANNQQCYLIIKELRCLQGNKNEKIKLDYVDGLLLRP